MKIKIIDNKSINDIIITIEGDKTSPQIEQILTLLNKEQKNESLIVGDENEKIRVFYDEIICFYTEDHIVYVKTTNSKYKIKYRIYELEHLLPEELFVKINQGVIANIHKIKRVTPCMNGTMKIEFLNGDLEYASRRSVKNIKERLGL